MKQGKWMVAGFVVGLAVAGGASLLLRDDAAREQEQARVGELKAQVERLESAVTKLSTLLNEAHVSTAVSTNPSTAGAAPQTALLSTEKERNPTQLQAIAEADALVDLGLQSGRWTRQQQDELGAAIGDLDVKEQGRILARVSKAINDGQVKFDPSR